MNEVDLLLIRLKTPENVGACYRLANQFGVKKIYNYKCREAGRTNTSKAETKIPIEYIDSLDFLAHYPNPKYILETGGQSILVPLLFQSTSARYLLAVANEGGGANKDELKLFTRIFTLPAPNTVLHEKLISYNVSHALAIGLFLLEYGRR